MTESDLKILRTLSAQRLAEIYCILNRFGWPEDLGEFDEGVSHGYIPDGRKGQIMQWIRGQIGIRECLREWNRVTLPGAKFDEWWRQEWIAGRI